MYRYIYTTYCSIYWVSDCNDFKVGIVVSVGNVILALGEDSTIEIAVKCLPEQAMVELNAEMEYRMLFYKTHLKLQLSS